MKCSKSLAEGSIMCAFTRATASNSIGPKVFSRNIPTMDMPQRISASLRFPNRSGRRLRLAQKM